LFTGWNSIVLLFLGLCFIEKDFKLVLLLMIGNMLPFFERLVVSILDWFVVNVEIFGLESLKFNKGEVCFRGDMAILRNITMDW
jgi:hypothetical protein